MEKEVLRIRELPDDIRECILEGESWKDKGLEIIVRGMWVDRTRIIVFKYNDKFWRIEMKKDDRPRYPSEPRYYVVREVEEVFLNKKGVYE